MPPIILAAISDSPKRVDHAHTHRADAGNKPLMTPTSSAVADPMTQNGGVSIRVGRRPLRALASTGMASNGETAGQEAAEDGDDQRFRENKEQHGEIRKADGLEHRQFAGAFAHGNGHGVAGHQQAG